VIGKIPVADITIEHILQVLEPRRPRLGHGQGLSAESTEPGVDRVRDPLEHLVTKILQLEQIAEKASGGVRDHHHVRVGKAL